MGIVESAVAIVRLVNRYAASPNFLGYFESLRPARGIPAAIELFSGFFNGMWSRGFLLLSIAECLPRAPAQTAQVRKVLDSLSAMGWLSTVDERSDSDFKVIPLSGSDRRAVRDLCELALEGFLFGHIFFFWSEEELVVYPHNDRGFGAFAAPGAAGVSIGRGFLQEAAKDAAFSVDIRS